LNGGKVRRFAVLSLVLLLGAGLGRIRAQANDNAKPETQVAPDFTLTDVNGDQVTLSDLLQNGPVYMESWDLPCVNCIAELDALVPIYDSLESLGLQVIALSVDKPADEARVKSFAASKKWPYIVLLDQQEAVMKQYGIIIKPTAYLINQQSEIVFTHIGYKKGDEDRIKGEFLKVLPGPAADSSGPAPKGEN
jgi:peroxiredoxin